MVTVYGLGAFLPHLKGLVRDIRTVWTLEELGIAYERKVLDAMKGEHKQAEFLALNPFGKVPTLVDGETTLFESVAICNYLGDKVGKLLPQPGTSPRYVYDQWMGFAVSTLEPLCSRVVGIDWMEADKTDRLLKYRNDNLVKLKSLIQVLDSELESRPYILGEAFSIADIMLCSVLRFLNHTEITSALPNVDGYLKKNFSRPAFLRALANNG